MPYTEPKTLPDLIKRLAVIQEPALGASPDLACFQTRRDFVVRVAEAVAAWVKDESLLIIENSRGECHSASPAQRAEWTGRDIFEVIRDGIGAHLDDADEAAAELQRHPDAYTAIAAE